MHAAAGTWVLVWSGQPVQQDSTSTAHDTGHEGSNCVFHAHVHAAQVRLRAAADPLALRGAAAALNNLGATAQMLGQR